MTDDIDVGRGDMLARPGNLPRTVLSLDAMVVWLGDARLVPGRSYLLKQSTRTVKASCAAISYRVDPGSLRRGAAAQLQLNDIGRVRLTLFQPIHVDDYWHNRATGSFILIDPESNATVGAGMVVLRQSSTDAETDRPVSRNISWQTGQVGAAERAALLGQRPLTIWLTGLSGAGKSTLAQALERQLMDSGRACYVLDGDNVRQGLNRDLGFSPDDRRENIRRVAEVARLMNDSGLIVISAFISPYREDREIARRIVGERDFVEVYLSADLETCERRDPKGLYRKARSGEIAEFTAVSAPYEPPLSADLVLDTASLDLDRSIERLLETVSRLIAGDP